MSRRPIKVLLIEDSDYDAALLLLELRHGGYDPVYERVETAFAMLAALDKHAWDVVIADYVLPSFSGPGALKLLQERGLDLPFIIVSGHIDEDTAVASMKAGAHDYVMKDRLTRLVPAIEREMQEAEVRRARKQSEEKFKKEQTFRHAIEDSIPSGIISVDRDGAHTYVNPAFCDMVGWTESELLGTKPPYLYWPPEEVETIQQALSRIIQGNAPSEGFELGFQHRSGKRFDVLFLASPINDNQGQVTGWLASVTDITERKRAEHRLRVQYAVARALSEAATLKAATPRILESIGESIGWEMGALWRANREGTQLHCVDVWQKTGTNLGEFATATLQSSCFQGTGLPGLVLSSGQPLCLSDITKEMELPRRKIAASEGLHGACGFPIHHGNETLGVIEFFSHEVRVTDETLLQWMVAIGNQIGQFIEREEAQEGLRRAHDELEKRVQERTADLVAANAKLENSIQERRRLENELLEITEKERRRIGLDLHDDLGQKLAGITLMMKGLELGLKKKNLPEAEEAHRIQTLVNEAMHHASDLARDLAIAELEEENLSSALNDLASKIKKLFEISCRFKYEGDIPSLDRNTVTQFYKISQEAVTNAVKHGKAKQVNINLSNKDEQLVLTIRNNGLLFPSMIDRNKGMGLRIMNYRANVIGASLDIKPGRPNGTVVTCTLPLKGHASPSNNRPISPVSSPRLQPINT